MFSKITDQEYYSVIHDFGSIINDQTWDRIMKLMIYQGDDLTEEWKNIFLDNWSNLFFFLITEKLKNEFR